MKNIIHNDFKVEKKLIKVIEPWVDVNNIKPLRKKDNPFSIKYISNAPFVVLYSGNMGISHDIESILDAAKSLKDKDDILKQLIEFTQYVYDQQTSAHEGEAQKAPQNTEEAYGTWKPESN